MSGLKITDVKTYIVPTVPAHEVTYNWSGTKQFLIVKIETIFINIVLIIYVKIG